MCPDALWCALDTICSTLFSVPCKQPSASCTRFNGCAARMKPLVLLWLVWPPACQHVLAKTSFICDLIWDNTKGAAQDKETAKKPQASTSKTSANSKLNTWKTQGASDTWLPSPLSEGLSSRKPRRRSKQRTRFRGAKKINRQNLKVSKLKCLQVQPCCFKRQRDPLCTFKEFCRSLNLLKQYVGSLLSHNMGFAKICLARATGNPRILRDAIYPLQYGRALENMPSNRTPIASITRRNLSRTQAK